MRFSLPLLHIRMLSQTFGFRGKFVVTVAQPE
jgi:hypothetical protein